MKLLIPLLLLWTFSAESYASDSLVLYYQKFGKIFHHPTPKRNNTFFGYSLTYQPTYKQLIISAPRGDDIGQVFACDIDNEKCSKITTNIKKDKSITNHDYWLGATVTAGSDYLMTCSPRHVQNMNKRSKVIKSGIFSKCFYQKGSSTNPLIPLKDVKMDVLVDRANHDPKIELQMTTFGWSIFADEENKRMLVGGPAMFKGRVAVYGKENEFPVLLTEKNVMHNFGYSITGGRYLTETFIYAISTPYGEIGIGKILFYDTDNKYIDMPLIAKDVGQMFGASLCTANLGSSLDVLLVGAPAYATSYDGYFKGYDQGAVFMYRVMPTFLSGKLLLEKTILGKTNGGYFGNSIVNIGDLTDDGKDEIAIAAPYENEGSGAVYIYSGADLDSDVMGIEPIQVIRAEDQPNLGLGLTTLKNHYGHGCNELVIGAAGSDSALLLMCIGSVDIRLQANLKSNEFKNMSSADIKILAEKLYKSEASFKLDVCVHINATKITRQEIKTVILISTTINHPHAKLIWIGTKTKTLYTRADLSKNKTQYCEYVDVILPFEGDYSKIIDFNISAALEKDPIHQAQFNPALVLISNSSVRSIRSSGPNLDLKTNLSLDGNTTLSDTYLIGSSQSEEITLVARNSGYVAYGACLRLRIFGATIHASRNCTKGQDSTCNISEPFTSKKPWVAKFTLDTKSMLGNVKSVDIKAEILDRCRTVSGIPFIKNITVTASENQVFVLGFSMPIEVNVMQFATESLRSQTIEHEYTIINNGMTKWSPFKCLITLPRQYVTHSVSAGESGDCVQHGNYTSLCSVKGLEKIVKIRLTMNVKDAPTILDKLDSDNVTIISNITFTLRDETKRQSITTTVQLQKVPLWVIIAAALIGFIVLLMLGYALYRCGFLRRKNKEKLEKLKTSVKRQTIRRSMMLRDSVINANNPRAISCSRTSLLNEMEGNANANEIMEDEHARKRNNSETANMAKEHYTKEKEQLNIKDKEPQTFTKKEVIDRANLVEEEIQETRIHKYKGFQKELAITLGKDKLEDHQNEIDVEKHDVVVKAYELATEVIPKPVPKPRTCRYADNNEVLQQLRKRNTNNTDID